MKARLLVAGACVTMLLACGSSSKSEPAQAVTSCEDAARSAQQASSVSGSVASVAPSVVADETGSDHLRVFTIRGVVGGRAYTCTNTRAPSDGKLRPLVVFDEP